MMEHLDALQARTIPELLRLRAVTHPSKVVLRFLGPGAEEREVTFTDLHRRSSAAAQRLLSYGVKRGDVVPIVLDTGPQFVDYFLGAMAAGAIPVALPVPLTPPIAVSTAAAIGRVGASVVVTEFENLADAAPGLTIVQPIETDATADRPLPDVGPDDTAMMQFSSGTTGVPHGILLTHYNLLTTSHISGLALRLTEADVGVSWLPLFHDMGLIGGVINPIYHAVTTSLMSPLAFLMRPSHWLQMIGKYHATVTGGPNAAFEMCNRKVTEADLSEIDLSSLRIILCGAELVREQTLRRFVERFARAGLRPTAFLPVYGLGENTLAVTFPEVGADLAVDCVEPTSMSPGCPTISSAHGTSLVGVGSAAPWHDVIVADAQRNEADDGTVGYVWVKGPCVMKGYYRDPDATAAVLHDGWLKTGDLAYKRNGTLFICGRESDLIIKAGRNVSAFHVENACQCLLPELGRVAAFGAYDEEQGTEAIVLMAETSVPIGLEQDRLRFRIRSVLVQQSGVMVDHVWLVVPRTIPHTTSGKIQRNQCRQLWQERVRA